MKDKKEQTKEEKVDSKTKKPRKKFKIIFLSILLTLLIVGVFIGYTQYYLPETTEYTLSLYKENGKLIEDIHFKKDSFIQILDEEDKIIETIDLKEDTNKLILENKEKDLVIDSWNIEKKIDEKEEFYKRDILYFDIKPIYQNKQNHIITFKADDDKAKIVEDKEIVKYIKVPYKKDTNISKYLPEVEVHEDFKGDWYIGNTKIKDDTKVNRDTDIVFKTYQDKNNNFIDDFTEEFTIKFNTNIEEKVGDKIVKWEETILLPTLKDKTKVFYEWYEDKDFENEFTEESKVTKDMNLHAKIRTFEEVVNNSVDDPINRKDIQLQIKRMLDDRNKKVDDFYKQEIDKVNKAREEKIKRDRENNISEQAPEQIIKLHNTRHNKIYLVTFLDPSSEYIFSITMPYGQTLKIVNEKGDLVQEHGIRQDTSIILDENILISKGKKLDKYHTEYRQINDSVLVKLQPITK